jgi:glycosyltransferase involved in cell wall biosynthesis
MICGMRVLYSFPDEVGRAGIGTTAFNQIREVALHGVDVTLYCTSLRGELPENVQVVQTLSIGGRRVPHRVLGIERSYRYHDRRVAKALRRIHAEIDVLHCWPRATVHTCVAAGPLGIPCLREVPNTHTAHALETVAREFEELGLEPPRGHSHTYDAGVLALEEREYAVADALLVPSEYSLETFVARGTPREKLVLHRYGYDPQRFFASNGNRPDRVFTAVFVGRCEPRKGLHYALKAWHDSGAAEKGRFIICGSFERDYREVLEPLLDHPSVEVHGFVSDPSSLMREGDVFILPSVEEGSALVVYEAQACGCVPLVSEAAGSRCRDGVDGFVHRPRDVTTLTKQLAQLHVDPQLVERMRTAGLARAGQLTWSAAGAELAEIYAGQSASRRSGDR